MLGVLTVRLRARCSVKLVSGAGGILIVNFCMKWLCDMSMCISAAQARTNWCRGDLSSEGLVLLARRVRFWAMSISRGRRGTFCALLKRWQARVKMRGALGGHFVWQAQYSVNLDDVLKGSKSRFAKLSSNLIWDMMMSLCDRRRTSDVSGSFFVAGAILCRPRSGWDRGKRSFLTFSMFMFRGGRNVLWKSNTCSCNPLVTLCASDRSRCGAARIVRSLAQPFRHFVRIGSLSLWRGANCEIAGASVSLLCAHRIALVVARSLGLWDRSCCGAVGILTLLVQPSRHFGPVRSLSLWHGAGLFDSQGDLVQRSCKGGLL